MRPADRAWLTLAAAVLAWEIAAPKGELLSEASARYQRARPLLWPVVIVYLAGHLLHVWGERDPLTRLAAALGR